jgi:hypothetical protein
MRPNLCFQPQRAGATSFQRLFEASACPRVQSGLLQNDDKRAFTQPRLGGAMPLGWLNARAQRLFRPSKVAQICLFFGLASFLCFFFSLIYKNKKTPERLSAFLILNLLSSSAATL